MTEVRFYHLTRGTLESALPIMLERTLARGQRAVVQCGTDERAETLCNHLWAYAEASFLPHGTDRDGRSDAQPIWLTADDETAPNGAAVLFLVEGADSTRIGDYNLCAVLFDGKDSSAVESGRSQWRRLNEAGHELTYWQQDDKGRWSLKD